MNINYDKLPVHLRGGMRRYIEAKILPGGFLRAVLSNDLRGAMQKADPVCLMYLPDIVEWCNEYVPAAAWGSYEVMHAWAAKD